MVETSTVHVATPLIWIGKLLWIAELIAKLSYILFAYLVLWPWYSRLYRVKKPRYHF